MEPSGWPAYIIGRNRELPLVSRGRFSAVSLAVALGAAGLLLSPAFAAGGGGKRPAAVSLSLDSDFQFTPASADPRLAAAFSDHSASLGDFNFTPAAAKGRPSQVRVAIRAHSVTPDQLASSSPQAQGPRPLPRSATILELPSAGAASPSPATLPRPSRRVLPWTVEKARWLE